MRTITPLICLSICAPVLAGQLAPPVGPVSPTMKTLVEVEPRTAITQDNTPGNAAAVFVISRPGSYYLTDNLFGAANKNGILVQAAGVTIDLNGFACLGVATAFDAIRVNGAFNEIRISNGVITNWGGDGIDANSSNSSVLRDLVITNNSGSGAFLNNNYLVENIIARNNGGNGLDLAFQGVVRNSECSFNGGDGVRTRGEGQIIECVTLANGGDGIDCGIETIVVSCFTRSNTSTGIRVGTVSQVLNSTSQMNGSGISIGSNSIVRGCLADGNNGHGIILASRCWAVGNMARGNGFGAAANFCGIITFGLVFDGVIDGNTVIGNEIGVCVSNSATGWTVVRNIARGNTLGNYSIPGALAAGAIVANPAAAGPWDNLSN